MKRRLMTLAGACVLALAGLTACGAASTSRTPDQSPATDDRLSVVTTIFPAYDWTREILGERREGSNLTLLLDDGTDLHSYQPTVEDLARLSDCDVFVYVGGESDLWVEDALANAQNPDMVVVKLLDLMGSSAKEEGLVEGMEADHEHGHDEAEHEHAADGADHEHEADKHDHSHETPEYDEHVWLSLRSAQLLSSGIADALCQADPDNADAYRTNAAAYGDKLADLDARFQAAVDAGTKDTLLFGDRFPFRYLVDDYGLSYYAAFAGCSAESEASFETIAFLARKTDELGLDYVLAIEGPSHEIAQAVIDNSSTKDQEILVMDSMQATSASAVEAGASYLSIMEANLSVLKQALA